MSHRLRLATLPLAALLVAACSSGTEPDYPPGSVALEVAAPDSAARYVLFHSGFTERQRLVVRDSATWARLWDEATVTFEPRPPLPRVNFAHETLIIAAMGVRSTGGYSIHVAGAFEAEGRVHVVVRERSPGPSCVVTAALTAPVVMVRVLARTDEVTFLDRASTRECEAGVGSESAAASR